MPTFVKFIAIIFAVILVFITTAILGGSMIWTIGGAHSLDIEGRALKVRAAPRMEGWTHYGGNAGGARYSSLDEITRKNVKSLEVAWTYSTGDLETKPVAIRDSAGETTPILVEDSLVFCTPFNEVIAVDPGTGRELWRYDPQIDLDAGPANQFVCRGVAYWKDTGGHGLCASRIFTGTNDGRLIALDAKTGKACPAFGAGGEVMIDPGMGLIWPGEFQITSPPAIAGDVVIVGSSISDNARVKAPHGTVRAFDARSGALLWSFDPIPRRESAPNAGSWKGKFPPVEGHANAWAPMSVDAERGLVFVPTSSPSPDFYGGLRPGDNRYANSVVALDVKTGGVVWSFQTVHHDVWDYDVPSQPGLYTIWKDGQAHDVVVQSTKMGLIFVLDRDTGEPFLPVEERPVPQGGAPGEWLSPTQPFPVATPPLVPNTITPEEAFGITWFDKRACADRIRGARADGLFTPPSLQGTIVYPFTGGGGNWGGTAFDPSRNLLVVNMSNLAHLIQLIPADEIKSARETFPDSEISPQTGAPYGMRREILLSPLGLPCTPPPWGILAAVDLSDGHIVWRRTFGTTKALSDGLAPFELGTPTLGGPLITGGDLIFIGASTEKLLRAFDVETGEELWRGHLPAAGIATPMTYEWNGRQYVVIFAGGYGNLDLDPGDSLVAFALPESPATGIAASLN